MLVRCVRMANGYPDGHLSDRVHQATGMISAQLNCEVDEAFNRLKIRAAAMDQTLDETALDVLNRVIRFD